MLLRREGGWGEAVGKMQKKPGVFHIGFRTEGPKHRTAAKCVKAAAVSHGRAISRTTFRLQGHGVKWYGGSTLCRVCPPVAVPCTHIHEIRTSLDAAAFSPQTCGYLGFCAGVCGGQFFRRNTPSQIPWRTPHLSPQRFSRYYRDFNEPLST